METSTSMKEENVKVKDKYGREIDYLRISLTDACNLRCIYCMPEENVKFNNVEGALSNEELEKIIDVFGSLGTKKLRFTGGEPLLRKDIDKLIYKAKSSGIEKIAITTNGILLVEKIESLVKAGLSEVNISLDTLDEERFKMITRGGELHRVLDAIDLSLKNGIKVKINAVMIDGINEDEFINLCKLSVDRDLDVRFIELMPIGEGIKFKGKTQEELLHKLKESFVVENLDKEGINGPANYVKIQNGKGRIGFISAMSNHFCDSCNRIRITPDGFLKQCLHFKSGINLKKLLEEEDSANILEEKIKDTIFNKPIGHKFNEEKKAEDNRFMFQIGG
ncbi:MAG: GTP 3',8-cyclase MoaA [Sarcina sp.]